MSQGELGRGGGEERDDEEEEGKTAEATLGPPNCCMKKEENGCILSLGGTDGKQECGEEQILETDGFFNCCLKGAFSEPIYFLIFRII